MPTFVRLAVAAVLAIAVGAVVLSQVVQPSGPSVGAEPTPGWQDRFPTQTASTFVRPFSYAIDPSTGIELSNAGSCDEVLSSESQATPGRWWYSTTQPRATAWSRAPRTVARINAQPTPEEFVAYMQTVPGFKVTALPPTTIDGRTALGIDVQQRARPGLPGALSLQPETRTGPAAGRMTRPGFEGCGSSTSTARSSLWPRPSVRRTRMRGSSSPMPSSTRSASGERTPHQARRTDGAHQPARRAPVAATQRRHDGAGGWKAPMRDAA